MFTLSSNGISANRFNFTLVHFQGHWSEIGPTLGSPSPASPKEKRKKSSWCTGRLRKKIDPSLCHRVASSHFFP